MLIVESKRGRQRENVGVNSARPWPSYITELHHAKRFVRHRGLFRPTKWLSIRKNGQPGLPRHPGNVTFPTGCKERNCCGGET
jgi:hypothetical protein